MTSHSIEFVNSIAVTWWRYAVPMAFQSAIVGAAIIGLVLFGRRWSSQLRYALLLVALVKFALPPFMASPTGIMSWIGSSQIAFEQDSIDERPAIEQPFSHEANINGPKVDTALQSHQEVDKSSDDNWVRELRASTSVSDPRTTLSGAGKPSIHSGDSLKTIAALPSSNTVQGAVANSLLIKVQLSWRSFLFISYIAGVIWILVSIIIQAVRLKLLISRSRAATQDELTRLYNLPNNAIARRKSVIPLNRISIRFSVHTTAPFSAGLLRRVIVLPENIGETLSENELRTVIAHEEAHHRRADLWVNLFQSLMLAMWWFHPVMWFVNRLLKKTREDCCDDIVVSNCAASQDDYCDTLLRVARFANSQDRLSALTVSMARREHAIAARLRRIMDDGVKHRSKLSLSGWAAFLAIAFVLLPGLRSSADQNTKTVKPEQTASPANIDSPTTKPKSDSNRSVETLPDTKADKSDSISKTDSTSRSHIVSGKVTDASGKKVAGAKVWLVANHAWDQHKVIAQGNSDKHGDYLLNPKNEILENYLNVRYSTYAVIAFHPDYGIAGYSSEEVYPTETEELSFNADIRTEFTLQTPADKPAANVKVLVPNFHAAVPGKKQATRHISLPEELKSECASTTDMNGHVVLKGINSKDYLSLEFASGQFGMQCVHLSKDNSKSVLKLGQVGSVTGKFILPDGVSMKQVQPNVTIVSGWKSAVDQTPHWIGMGKISADSSGKFTIPHLRQGNIKIIVRDPETSETDWMPLPPEDFVVNAHETLNIDIPFTKTVSVKGRVLDQDSKFPIRNVLISMQSQNQHLMRVTDDMGMYAFSMKSNSNGMIHYHAAPPYIDTNSDGFNGHQFNVSDFEKEHTLDDVHLMRGGRLQGQVLNEADEGIPNISVTARWRNAKGRSDQQVMTSTDREGRFHLDGIMRSQQIKVAAWKQSVKLTEKSLSGYHNDDIELKIKPIEYASLAGRVLDHEGKPISEAAYQIVQSSEMNANSITFGPVESGKTTKDGTFKSNMTYPRNGTFEVQVLLDKAPVDSTSQRINDKDGVVTFQDLIVKPKIALTAAANRTSPANTASAIASKPSSVDEEKRATRKSVNQKPFVGKVVNTQNEPVAFAKVVAYVAAQRMRFTTDEQGQFKIPSVSVNGVWIYANAPNYRFAGTFVKPLTNPVLITLSKATEPDPHPIRPLSIKQLTNEQLDSIKKQYRDFAEVVMASEDHSSKWELQRIAPRLDPEFAVKLLSDNRFDIKKINMSGSTDPKIWHENCVYQFAMEKYLRTDMKKAEEMAQATTEFSVQAWSKYVDALPEDQQAKKVEILEKLRKVAIESKSASSQIEHLTKVATSFDEIGETKRAKEVFKEALVVASTIHPKKNSRLPFARRYLATSVARYDLQAGLDLLELVAPHDYEHSDAYGKLAYNIADVNPSEAERVLGLIDVNYRSIRAVPVCYRMAAVDFPRAIRIADKISMSPLQAYARGMMARAVFKKDPAKAKELIKQAYDQLETLIESNYSSGTSIYMPYPVAVSLLRQVEEVNPDQLSDHFWRVLSWRRDVTYGSEMRALGHNGEGNKLRLSDPVLATFVSRYDLTTAQEILMPVDDETLQDGVTKVPTFFFAGLTAIDPLAATGLIDQLSQGTTAEIQVKEKAWESVINMLDSAGDNRWNKYNFRQFNLWNVDDVDWY